MTKEEREKAIEFGKMWLDMNEDAKDSETYLFFSYALESLEQEMMWIPVSKRLPNQMKNITRFW